MPTSVLPVLFATASTLADAHLKEVTFGTGAYHPMNFDVTIGDNRLVVQRIGALYSATLFGLVDQAPGVIAAEWDSAVTTAINLCATKAGVTL